MGSTQLAWYLWQYPHLPFISGQAHYTVWKFILIREQTNSVDASIAEDRWGEKGNGSYSILLLVISSCLGWELTDYFSGYLHLQMEDSVLCCISNIFFTMTYSKKYICHAYSVHYWIIYVSIQPTFHEAILTLTVCSAHCSFLFHSFSVLFFVNAGHYPLNWFPEQ